MEVMDVQLRLSQLSRDYSEKVDALKGEIDTLTREYNEQKDKLILDMFVSVNDEKRSKDNAMTVREAAEYLKLSQSALRNLIRERRVVFLRLGGAIRFTRKDLDEYMENMSSDQAVKEANQYIAKKLRFRK